MESAMTGLRLQGKSTISLIQSVSELLRSKYQNSFDFYQGKNINRILFQQTHISRSYKYLLDFIEDTQYLKKYYKTKNSHGKNQLSDRMTLLRKFYLVSDLLQWQHPMMTINNLQSLFQKRHQKINKINSQSDSEQHKQAQPSPNSQIFVKTFNQQDQCLVELDWSDVLLGKFLEQNSIEEPVHKKSALEYEEQEYCIYDGQRQIKRKNFLEKIGVIEQFQYQQSFKWNDNQRSMEHLIIDFDDMDKKHVIEQYEKLSNKENTSIHLNGISDKKNILKNKITSFSQIKKPLSSSLFVPCDQSSSSTPLGKSPSNISKQSMLIGSRQERFKEKQFMKRSSLAEIEKSKNFLFPQHQIITQNQGEQYPVQRQSKKLIQYLTPDYPRDLFVSQFRFIGQNLDRKYVNPQIEQYQILSRKSSELQISKSKQMNLKFSQELNLFKEKPLKILNSFKKKYSDRVPTKTLSRVKSLQTLQRIQFQQQDNQVDLPQS